MFKKPMKIAKMTVFDEDDPMGQFFSNFQNTFNGSRTNDVANIIHRKLKLNEKLRPLNLEKWLQKLDPSTK